MGEQHARRIELAAIETVEGAVAREAGRVIMRGLGAGLRERVAEPLAPQHATIKEALLLFGSLQAECLEHEVWNLADRAVGAGQGRNHARHGSRTHAGPAVNLRYSDGEQARIGNELHLFVRKDALTIAVGGALRQFRRELLGDCNRLRVVADAARDLVRSGGERNSVTSSSSVASAALMRGMSPSTRQRSAPGVSRGRNAVEEVVADMEILPPHRIMQRMGARVAPMPVEIVLAEGRARAAELLQLVGRQNRDFGRHHLGRGDLDCGRGDRFLARIVEDPVDRPPGALKRSLGGVQLDFEIADLRDREDVLVAVLMTAVDPRPYMTTYKANRLIDRAARDAGVDRRLMIWDTEPLEEGRSAPR